MVDSPKDPPNSEFGISATAMTEPQTPAAETGDAQETSGQQAFKFDIPPPPPIDPNDPIDVNEPRDTSNIFYDYEEPKQPNDDPSMIIERNIDVPAMQANEDPSTSGTNINSNSSQQIDNKETSGNCSSSDSCSS